MLSRVAAHVLCGHVREYRPLLAKLSTDRCRQLAETFDARRLNTLDPAVDVLNPKPWFQFRTQTNAVRQTQSLQALDGFDHTRTWACDENVHGSKREAFDTKAQRAAELSNITGTINVLKCDASTHADDIDAAAALRNEISSKDKLMFRRMRKYRLYPTAEQRKQLLQFMGTCRYTYNLAVAHFRATNVSKATTLRDLYVTELSKKERVYPEGIGPPPKWAYDTPKNFRYNALRKFETNVKSAFSNKANGNISNFNIQFKSRKKDGRFFPICEDASTAKITYRDGESRAMLSITKMKNIPIQCDPGLEISNEIQITNTNGLWYAVIPQFVRPSNYVNCGRTVALDPGVKAFMTGVDLDGNALHVGRGTR
ncbi:hypothetical protein BBJ28_00007587 [Nothophytophthora sp. Chile5]|nr:hypothetical protein BBJ28_00007587 [Nothophytophthora sp. Chile5]